MQVCAGSPSAKKAKLETLRTEFTSSKWSEVRAAKEAMESMQTEAIPVLISLLDRYEHVKLQDTADLIYPGAKEFWGHGGIIDYDIDWLSVRAGWALEDLIFQSFGFREGAIDEGALLKAVMAGKADSPLSDVLPMESDPELKRERRKRAASVAEGWWTRSGDSWNRLTALLDALKSGNPARQVTALNWLRFGETRCDGLSKKTFTQSMLPEVRRLTGSADPGVKEQADYLLRDFESNEWYWLHLKDPNTEQR
jgi:hypothetical protein